MYESADQLLERVPEDNGASCILLDVNIPGLSGPQLRERLAMLGSSMPVVFLTGNDENLASLQPAKSSVEEFLTKPIRREKLIHAIERAVAHSWDRRENADRLKALVREC